MGEMLKVLALDYIFLMFLAWHSLSLSLVVAARAARLSISVSCLSVL
jgi:hypothetical protein